MTIRTHAEAEEKAERYAAARDVAKHAVKLRDALADELRSYIRETGAEVDYVKGNGKFTLRTTTGRVTLTNPEAALDAGFAKRGEDIVSLVWQDWTDEEHEQYLAAIRRGVA